MIAQRQISGKIYEIGLKGDTACLPGATLFWLKTGKSTSSDINGNYSLAKIAESNILVIAYVGYDNDTSVIDTSQVNADFYLTNNKTLQEVNVVYRVRVSEFSYLDPMKIETI
ncbi:MAG TPA: carboxypeptidase-like regulatory domain-containing protein, partial [Nitrosopumilaceae archaeon]|nr:carboxypeptidase-like regulatory domain-containing protein [Nitrosopumilaceae archaeon]